MTNSVNIFVLNWNGENIIGDCLESLLNAKYKNKNIIVIDNGSSDDSIKYIHQKFPSIQIIPIKENLKYSKGNNFGFKKVEKSDFSIFLNNDTIVDPNFISNIIDPFNHDKDIAQVAPKILYDNSKLIWYAGGRVKLWLGLIYHIGIRKKDQSKFHLKREIDYASGCCFAVRSKIFESIGMFDESFEMYCEDVDLSLMIKKSGKKVIYAPKSIIWHKVSYSIGGENSLKKILLKNKAKFHLALKHLNPLFISISFIFITILLCFEIIFTIIKKNK